MSKSNGTFKAIFGYTFNINYSVKITADYKLLRQHVLLVLQLPIIILLY